MEVVKAWIILARSAVDGSAMGEDMEAAEVEGEAGVGGVVVVGWGGGGAAEDEGRLEADIRLSRAWTLKVGGPWLLNS
jgi:hypothetical protein